MILSRSSSTPIMSSMLDDGRGSSRNSFTPSSSKENLHKMSLPVGPCRPCKHIRRVSSENNLKSFETAEEFDHQGDSPMKYIAVNVHARKSRSKPRLEPILSMSNYTREDINNGCENVYSKNTDDGDLQFEFSFPPTPNNSVDQDHNNAGFSFFNISNGKSFPASNGKNIGPTSLCMAIAPDPMIFKQNTCINNDRDDTLQKYYENILKENPYNPMILRNYAHYMYKVRGVYKKAEELYSRALLVEPNDGEILSEFARLRWEVYGEKEAASNYFKRAVHASPQNSDVLAAYASFLWDTDEGEETHDSARHRHNHARRV